MKPTIRTHRQGVLDAARFVPGGCLLEGDGGEPLDVWSDPSVVAPRVGQAAQAWRAGHLGAATSQLAAQLTRQLVTGSVLAATGGVMPRLDPAVTRLLWRDASVVAAVVPSLEIRAGDPTDLLVEVVRDRIELLTPMIAALGEVSRLSRRVLWSTVVDDVTGGLVRWGIVTGSPRTSRDVQLVWDVIRDHRPVLPRAPTPWPGSGQPRVLVRSSCCFLYRTVTGPAWCTGCPLVDDRTAGRR